MVFKLYIYIYELYYASYYISLTVSMHMDGVTRQFTIMINPNQPKNSMYDMVMFFFFFFFNSIELLDYFNRAN